MGWRPHRDFSLTALKAQYLPPALFYMNMYYYTGLMRSFEMLICKSVDPGNDDAGEYLVADPETACWTGSHQTYAAIAGVGVFVYMVLLPATLAYVLLGLIPKRGLLSQTMMSNFGFLYHHFQPNLWWWELIEILRKLSFAVIAAWGTNMEPVNQSALACSVVLAILLCELYFHPFRSALYDVLEEFTTLTEVVVLILGILIIAAKGSTTGAFGWIEPTTYVFIALSIALIVYSLAVDFLALRRGPARSRALRKKHDVVMSPVLFNLQLHSHVIAAFVAQAEKEAITRMRHVESSLITWSLLKRDSEDAAKFAMWQEMSTSSPALIAWLMDPNYRSRKPRSEESNPAESYINSTIEMQRGAETDVLSFHLLTETGRGILLAWLSSEEATPDDIGTVRKFLDDLAEFDAARQTRLLSTTLGRILMASYSSFYDKQLRETEKKLSKQMPELPAKNGGGASMRWTSNFRTSMMDVRSSKAGKVSPAKDGNGGSVYAKETSSTNEFKDVKALLRSLLQQLRCDAVLVVPVSEHICPRIIVSSQMATLNDADCQFEPGTPLRLALNQKTPVMVTNILTDPRFDLTKVNKKSVSQLCVPLSDNVVLCVINKVATNSNQVVSFSASDLPVVKVYGTSVERMLAKQGVAIGQS